MTENDLDLNPNPPARPQAAQAGTVSASSPAQDVELRVTHGADRFAYYTEEHGEAHHVTRDPSPVAAGDVERVIGTAAAVGVTIEKIEE